MVLPQRQQPDTRLCNKHDTHLCYRCHYCGMVSCRRRCYFFLVSFITISFTQCWEIKYLLTCVQDFRTKIQLHMRTTRIQLIVCTMTFSEIKIYIFKSSTQSLQSNQTWSILRMKCVCGVRAMNAPIYVYLKHFYLINVKYRRKLQTIT